MKPDLEKISPLDIKPIDVSNIVRKDTTSILDRIDRIVNSPFAHMIASVGMHFLNRNNHYTGRR